MGQRADSADKQRDGHGGWHSLAANVADDRQQAAIRGGQHLVEIASNLARGLVDGFDGKAGDGRNFFRHEDLLDGAGRLQLGRGFLLLPRQLGVAEEDHHADGQQEQQVCNRHRAKTDITD